MTTPQDLLDAIKRANTSFAYRAYRGWSWRWACSDWFRRLRFELRENVWRRHP